MYAHGENDVMEIRGEKTEIYHNQRCGLCADTINVFIPSRPITALVHDNGTDLFTYDAGKIQSQLSSSSLELTVIHEAPVEDHDEDD